MGHTGQCVLLDNKMGCLNGQKKAENIVAKTPATYQKVRDHIAWF